VLPRHRMSAAMEVISAARLDPDQASHPSHVMGSLSSAVMGCPWWDDAGMSDPMTDSTGYAARSRPFAELSESGLLWLINRVVFHPRGFALALVRREGDGEITGWRLLGDGGGPWRMEGDEPEFGAAEATLASARESRHAASTTP